MKRHMWPLDRAESRHKSGWTNPSRQRRSCSANSRLKGRENTIRLAAHRAAQTWV